MAAAMAQRGINNERLWKKGADIIIATPGRLIALLATGKIILDHLEHLVLDEADRMLDMGFYDDIVKIINYLPKKRQTVLFSATMPPKIRVLANKILNQPVEINISIAKPAAGILQQAYVVYDEQKGALIKHVLKNHPWNSVPDFRVYQRKCKKIGCSFSACWSCSKSISFRPGSTGTGTNFAGFQKQTDKHDHRNRCAFAWNLMLKVSVS
jgi:superfamily II DNA/RNA helicase